ncbi:MAG: ADP-ribosylation factor-like protein [Candidatus Hermodarchaeota archaeon]
MLRQLHIFNEKEHIFVKDYAIAFGNEELQNVQETINKYMDMPIPGKTISRRISNFQIFHRGTGGLYFLLVTDLIDTLQYMETVLTNIIKKFQELFPDPMRFKELEQPQDQFSSFLTQIQRNMQSKISIIGPIHAGKTTLYDILKTDEEKEMMDFAKSSTFNIDGLAFEIWDFQLQDNFSLLWPKFVSGSDLVILMFNLANYNLKTLNHFMNIQKLESKYSKLLTIGNKRDLINDEDIKRIKNEINITEFEEISLNSPDAKSEIQVLIKQALGLKEELPEDFAEMVKEAESLVNLGNIIQALAKYRELVQISTNYRDFEYINLFQKKVQELNRKLKEQKEMRREFTKELKFEIPKELKFKKKIEVQPLPTAVPSVGFVPQKITEDESVTPSEKELSKIVSFQKLETKPTGLKLIKPSEIPSKPVKPAKPVIFEKSVETSSKKPELKMPMELFPPHEDIAKDIKKPKISDYAKEVQKIISEKGSTLSLKLCELLVTDLEQSLGRPLTIEDIQLAADFFVKQEQSVQIK